MKFPKLFLLFAVAIIVIVFVLSHCGCLSYPSLNGPAHSERLSKILPFKPGEKFIYKVRYNGIYVGRIEWEYLGKQNIDNKLVDVIGLSSDVKILKLFSIQSKEKLYIIADTHLPLKVEREVKFLGKQEKILEEYNQKEGYVKIAKLDAKGKEEKKFEVKAPIHNIIALLYFFPQDIKLNLGDSFSFNLPTQEITIKVIALQMLDGPLRRYETFCLEGKPRKFKIWLEKDKRIPLQMEFPVFLGKVTVFKDYSKQK